MLTPSEKQQLESKLDSFERQTSKQIVIAALSDPKLDQDNFFLYSVNLSNYWSVGNSKTEEGIAIIFSSQLRQMRLNTTYATEAVLTDSICQQIIDNAIVRAFKKEAYYEGLNKATDQIMAFWN